MSDKISVNKNEAKLIDLDKVIRSQDNKMVRNLPQFVINIIKRVIKQKKLNELIYKNRDKYGVPFVATCMADYNVRHTVKGLENVPADGRYIFVSNHPLGAADYGSVITILNERFPDVKVLANEVLMFVENIKELLLPVSVFGKSNTRSRKDIQDTMASSDKQILTFPAGRVSRKIKGKVEDIEWNKSFIHYAKQYKREVVPILVNDKNSRMFYFVAGLRKFLRLKINLELFLIPGEFFKKANKTIPVIIGKPIPYERFDDSKTIEEWAQTVKREVYDLAR